MWSDDAGSELRRIEPPPPRPGLMVRDAYEPTQAELMKKKPKLNFSARQALPCIDAGHRRLSAGWRGDVVMGDVVMGDG